MNYLFWHLHMPMFSCLLNAHKIEVKKACLDQISTCQAWYVHEHLNMFLRVNGYTFSFLPLSLRRETTCTVHNCSFTIRTGKYSFFFFFQHLTPFIRAQKMVELLLEVYSFT